MTQRGGVGLEVLLLFLRTPGLTALVRTRLSVSLGEAAGAKIRAGRSGEGD